jgi:hypothetical protein
LPHQEEFHYSPNRKRSFLCEGKKNKEQ